MSAHPSPAILPVLLAGGAGHRLWPLSRPGLPKQFAPLSGPISPFQNTLARIANRALYADPLVMTGQESRFLAARQIAESERDAAALIVEPHPRNTGPAIALAALVAGEIGPERLLLALPCDHAIADIRAFDSAVHAAIPAAQAGAIVTFGIEPNRPASEYGYILPATGPAAHPPALAVDRFVEKPERATAEAFLADGRYLWNAGIFLARADALIDAFARHAPKILAGCRRAHAGSTRDLGFSRPAAAPYEALPSASFDTAVMERCDNAAVLRAGFAWSDLGEFDSLWRAGAHDDAGNATAGDTLVEACCDSYIRNAGRGVVAVGGANGLAVVATDDAVLVAPRDRPEIVRALLARLREAGRPEAFAHRRVHRPWGHYTDTDAGADFRVKRVVVAPGGRLSLQRHRHRSEHWVVVRGRATVTITGERQSVRRNQSVYVPADAWHRIENLESEPLHLIEVQVGDYVGEDDIERREDVYGRADPPVDKGDDRGGQNR